MTSPIDGSSPVAFAQAFVESKQANEAEAAQATLIKKEVDSQGQIAKDLIESAAAPDGRKLLATA